ncbi:MAG: D-glycero-beta-D-manno-heptose 1-phosphate adenylyltransferase [Candidatus Adiutrix sp.]|jgi:D-beta-D-heptose 7-phosphate kinase/D-beta-D-heptose 1-phosphate adenosyltransferase|nr:D-glycero-beta-D-manno-heptose 1-phosphate adenylyltransferase [Candidatus Adiutrix sp.]
MDHRRKIMTLEEALAGRQKLAAREERLVFTNGCFDLLHPGHLRYLAEARSLGDFLMVGLNSDRSVRALKGPTRPVCPQEVRAEMLAGLEMVDGVLLFDQDSPLNLILALSPDILVKGGDWAVADMVGGPFVLARGGEVRSLSLAGGFSSTALIERLRARP